MWLGIIVRGTWLLNQFSVTEEVFMASIPSGRVPEINEEIVGFPDMNYLPWSGNGPWVIFPL